MARPHLWIRPGSIKYKQYLDLLKNHQKFKLKIDETISSMGDCSIRNLNSHIKSKYKYITSETNKIPWIWKDIYPHDKDFLPSSHGSAAWERVYNTDTIRHIVEYSFGIRDFDRFYKFDYNGKRLIADLIRSRIIYPDPKTADVDVFDHISCSKKVLEDTNILFIVLGMTEAWESKSRNFSLASYPKNIGIEKQISFKNIDFENNLKNLYSINDTIKKYNPDIKILLSVSPAHFNASFRSDIDVFSAGCASKSILRAVVDKFVLENNNAMYFPMYEIVTMITDLFGLKPYKDGHHISTDAEKMISSAFDSLY